MTTIGARGLVAGGDGGSGGAVVNPYDALPGLVALWSADTAIAHAPTEFGESIEAAQNRAATQRVPMLVQPTMENAPRAAGLNAGHLGFAFDAAHSQHLYAWHPAWDLIDDDGAMSLFAMVKTTQSTFAPMLCRGYAASRWRFHISGGGFGTLTLTTTEGGVTETSIYTDAPINDGQPHALLAIYDPAQDPSPTMSLWLDGVMQVMQGHVVPPLQVLDPAEPVVMGAIANGVGGVVFPFDGLVGDVGAFGRPLRDEAEIHQLFTILRGRFGL